MEFTVLTGKKGLRDLEGKDGLVIYLLKGGYNNEPLNSLELLYRKTITDIGMESLINLSSFLAEYGFKDKNKLYEVWYESGLCFFSFIELLNKKYNMVFQNFRKSMMSDWLLELIQKFKTRQDNTVIVGETNDVQLLNIKSYLESDSKILVVDDVSFVYSKTDQNISFVAIDGSMLRRGFDLDIRLGIPIYISELNKGFFFPTSLNNIVEYGYMTDDMVEGPKCVS